MSSLALISIGTVLLIVAAIATFIYGLNRGLRVSTKATLEVVSGALWMLGSAAILGALIQMRGAEFFDLLFVVLFLCGGVSLVFGIFHRGQLSNTKSIVQVEPKEETQQIRSEDITNQTKSDT